MIEVTRQEHDDCLEVCRRSRAAIIPVIRDTIVTEHADGDVVLRVLVAAEDVDRFWRCFPESNEAVFLSNEDGAIEAIRGPLMREYRDGSLAVKLMIGPQWKRRLRALWPKPGDFAVLVREDPEAGRQRMVDAAAAVSPARYGHLARQLRMHPPFMLDPRVWRAVGTDAQYLDWLRDQKCAHCRWTPHWEGADFLRCEAAHVRRVADGAGTGIKPSYSALPLCTACHAAQHQKGESYLGGRENVDKLRIKCVQAWVWETLKAALGFAHWSEVRPEALVDWAEDHGVGDCVPMAYRREMAGVDSGD